MARRYFVITPTIKVVETIWGLRKLLSSSGLGGIDLRAETLPHISVGYLDEVDDNTINQLIQNLDSFSPPYILSMEFVELALWKDNIVAIFDPALLSNLVQDLQEVAGRVGVQINKQYLAQYGTPVGDHMKIAREIIEKNSFEAMDMIKSKLSREIVFDRIALINYECRERDILWQRKLEVRKSSPGLLN